ncbi:phenoloxidase-activating factor 2-like [Panulirus ornatus]|uniref:phenoloxidase-activating factor 2-like n=1 Tax=Panulirus ornatus TaxID=150431 RepID=UPI003A891155
MASQKGAILQKSRNEEEKGKRESLPGERMRALIVTLALWAVATGQESGSTLCNNGQSKCVPYYLCKDGNIITDGAGLIDVRFGGNDEKQRTSSECPRLLDVCCKAAETTPPPLPAYQPKCGRRNLQGVHARVLNFKNNQAQFGEFPWMTAVLREETVAGNLTNVYVCGGSLIHPSVVLTAAHCVASYDASILKVRLGEWDTQRAFELLPHQDRKVSTKVIHENFQSGGLHNDFALLILDTPADLAPNVDTVCLPKQLSDFLSNECWATGWGKDKFGSEGVFQNVLKKVRLSTWNHNNCETALKGSFLGPDFVLHTSFICAGGKANVDTCEGDGGSPLVCEIPGNEYVQAGIVAWGIGCGQAGVPGVYANVPYALDWIKTKADEQLRLIGRYTPDYW